MRMAVSCGVNKGVCINGLFRALVFYEAIILTRYFVSAIRYKTLSVGKPHL